jgi:type VI protein secretion system component VasF
MAGCDTSPTISTPPAASARSLPAPANLRGPVRLTRAERDGHINSCRGAVQKVPGEEAGLAQWDKICDCIVNQMEDNASNLQFNFFMILFKTARGNGDQKQIMRELVAFKTAAEKSGITNTEIRQVEADSSRLFAVATAACKAG